MKFGGLILLAAGFLAARPALSQISLYADFSASKLSTNYPPNPGTNVFYGPTLGVEAKFFSKAGLTVSGDLRGSLLGGTNRLDSLVVGPQIAIHIKKYSPYIEGMFGFGRYNSNVQGGGLVQGSTTDALLQTTAGVDRAITKRLDWRVFEFGYAQYYAFGGAYNPKTFSTGVVFHLGER